LKTALDVEKRDLQIDGRGQIGLRGLQFFEPEDFRGVCARRT